MSVITRRNALVGIAATVALPTICEAASGIGNLWEKRQVCADRARLIAAEWDAAFASIPTWARPGPRLLNSDGEYSGATVGWPLDQSVLPPDTTGAFRACRLSPHDLTERFNINANMFPSRRGIFRKAFREGVRRLLPRLRAQKAEYARADMPGLEKRLGANGDAQYEIEDAIISCVPSIERTAACILIEVIRGCVNTKAIEDDGAMTVAAIALEGLQPSLSGLLAEHVAAYLQNRERPLKPMPFYGA